MHDFKKEDLHSKKKKNYRTVKKPSNCAGIGIGLLNLKVSLEKDENLFERGITKLPEKRWRKIIEQNCLIKFS